VVWDRGASVDHGDFELAMEAFGDDLGVENAQKANAKAVA
jgi:hypothetical protein